MTKDSAQIGDAPDAPPRIAPAESIFAHLLQMVEGMARGFAHIADTVPQASGLAALVKTMKTDTVKLRDMVIPAPKPEPEPIPEPEPVAMGGEPGGIVGPLGSEVPAPKDDPADHSADDLNHQELAEIEATQARSADGRFSS